MGLLLQIKFETLFTFATGALSRQKTRRTRAREKERERKRERKKERKKERKRKREKERKRKMRTSRDDVITSHQQSCKGISARS